MPYCPSNTTRLQQYLLADPSGGEKTSPEIIHLAVLMYVRFPLSLRNVENLLHERGIDVCHESVLLWVERVRPDLRPRDQETPGSSDAPTYAMALAHG